MHQPCTDFPTDRAPFSPPIGGEMHEGDRLDSPHGRQSRRGGGENRAVGIGTRASAARSGPDSKILPIKELGAAHR